MRARASASSIAVPYSCRAPRPSSCAPELFWARAPGLRGDPRPPLGGPDRADPDALRPRHGAGRHGLHTDLAGWHAHRRAEPDEADAGGRPALLRQHDPALPPPEVTA